MAGHPVFSTTHATPPEQRAEQGPGRGVGVEAVDDPLMRKVRQLDKPIDGFAKGKARVQILRNGARHA